MSLTQEDLAAISQLLKPLKTDMQQLKTDMQEVKADVQILKKDMQEVKSRITKVELQLENETNHNLQLLAENHMQLVDKLNQAIRVSDKTLLYEVQVSTLKSKVERLEEEITEIKNRIA